VSVSASGWRDARDDVDEDRDKGWNRFVELDDGRYRSRASLMPKEPDTLDVFRGTPNLADEARDWPEIPLPALQGKSPLEAVADKRLRPAVIGLLKSTDQLEICIGLDSLEELRRQFHHIVQSQNPQRSPAKPAVLLNQERQIQPKSARKTWYISLFRLT
jgi:hypothetical protein